MKTKIKTFFNEPRFNIAILFIHLGHLLKIPFLTAIGWRIGMYKNDQISCPSNTRKKIIILAKSGGIEDIEAAYHDEKADYSILFISRKLIKISCENYFFDDVIDIDYRIGDQELRDAKIAYRRYLESVLKSFKKLFGLNAVLQFSILYYAERELAAACSNLGIPFIAAHKENLRSKAAWSTVPEQLKKSVGKFNGYKISVYNSNAKEAMIKSGIAEPWQIEVTGCARMDFSHQIRTNRKAKKNRGNFNVLYYLIVPIAGLTVLFTKKQLKETYNWNSMIKKVNSKIISMSNQFQKTDFIIKGKTGYSSEQIEEFEENSSQNIELIRGGIGHHLLNDADVVIGFNTTAILESIAAGKPTIVPQIFSEKEQEISKYALDVCEAVHCPVTVEEFENILKTLIEKGPKQNEKLNVNQKNVLKMFMGNPDGKSGRRLKSFIDSAVYTDKDVVLESITTDESTV